MGRFGSLGAILGLDASVSPSELVPSGFIEGPFWPGWGLFGPDWAMQARNCAQIAFTTEMVW